jgi:hypothetical protein
MHSLLCWSFLCLLIIIGPAPAADIPCGYDETGFHEIAPPVTSGEPSREVTLSAPSQDRSAPLAGVPRISEPAGEVKSNIDLI